MSKNKKYDLVKIIDRAVIKEHSEIKNFPTYFILAGIFFTIWAIFYLISVNHHLYIIIISAFILSGLQHHLIILMHEGAHGLLHRDRKWNYFFGQTFCAFPFFMNLKDYQYIHLTHHQYSGDPQNDPEVEIYNHVPIGYGHLKNKVFKTILGDITLTTSLKTMLKLTLVVVRNIKEKKVRSTNFSDLSCGIFGLILLFLPSLYFNNFLEAILLWFITYFIFTATFVRWHGIGEHTGINAELEQDKTLTHRYSFFVNFFLYPINSGLHLEHHLFPRIPWYQMQSFRKKLMQIQEYKNESEKCSVDTFWFGNKSVRNLVLNK